MTSAESQQSLLIMLRVQLSFVVAIFVSFYFFFPTRDAAQTYIRYFLPPVFFFFVLPI